MSRQHTRKKKKAVSKETKHALLWGVAIGLCIFVGVVLIDLSGVFGVTYDPSIADAKTAQGENKQAIAPVPTLNTEDYNRRMLALAHFVAATTTNIVGTSTEASVLRAPVPVWTATTSVSVSGQFWPAKTVYPKVGALLPFHRIVAYYGNFYSKNMGVLGEYPEDELVQKLTAEVAAWNAADPTTPVIPAIHYIAVTAQGSAGTDGKYRLRMPDSQIDHAIELAKQVNGLVFLDIQVGLSDVETEVPLLEKYLSLPQVHLALDPEFSMKTGVAPGRVIGTMDASDINFAAQYLAKLVKEHNLPPKILAIHRFTENMVTNYKRITPLPEVQLVMDMDGWGFGAKKINTYKQVIYPEPVQFTGFKLFYKNDLKAPSTRLLTPEEVLSLTPAPSYIQYQ